MTIVQCRRRAADAKWLALSVSANTPELRAEREARYIRMRLSYSFLLILYHYMQHAQNIYSSINHCLFPVWFHSMGSITNDLFRSSKKAGTKDGMKASTAEGNSLRWKKLHFLACLICISTEIHRNTVSAFPYNNCRLKLKATGTAASTRHSK